MDYIIGVCSYDMQLGPLIERKLEFAHHEGVVMLGEAEGRAVVSAETHAAVYMLAGILADIMAENMQMRYVSEMIRRRYAHICSRDGCDLLTDTLGRLWTGERGADWRRQRMQDKLALCMYESKNGVIMLDGILRFRLKDEVMRWEKCLAEAYEAMCRRKERDDLIGILRYFVGMQEPAVEAVVIAKSKERYVIADISGRIIDECAGGESNADELLSRLIELAPASVDTSLMEQGELRDIIEMVFVERNK